MVLNRGQEHSIYNYDLCRDFACGIQKSTQDHLDSDCTGQNEVFSVKCFGVGDKETKQRPSSVNPLSLIAVEKMYSLSPPTPHSFLLYCDFIRIW